MASRKRRRLPQHLLNREGPIFTPQLTVNPIEHPQSEIVRRHKERKEYFAKVDKQEAEAKRAKEKEEEEERRWKQLTFCLTWCGAVICILIVFYLIYLAWGSLNTYNRAPVKPVIKKGKMLS